VIERKIEACRSSDWLYVKIYIIWINSVFWYYLMNTLFSAFEILIVTNNNNNNNNFRISASPSYTILTFLHPPNITPFLSWHSVDRASCICVIRINKMLAVNQRRCMINTIWCTYSKIPPDDEWLIYSKHVEDYFWNKLREKSASCWFVLRKLLLSWVPLL